VFPLTKVASNLISLTLAHEPRKSEENNDQKVCIGLQGCLALFKCPSLLAPLHLLTEWQQHLCSLRLPSIHIHSGVLFRVAFLIYNDLYSIRKRLPCFIPTAWRTPFQKKNSVDLCASDHPSYRATLVATVNLISGTSSPIPSKRAFAFAATQNK